MSIKNIPITENNIRDRFTLLLKYLNLNQGEFAKILGVSQSRISEFLTGKTENMSGDVILRLLVKYKVSPEWLLEGKGATFRKEPEILSFEEYTRANDDNFIAIEKMLSKIPLDEIPKVRKLLEVFTDEK